MISEQRLADDFRKILTDFENGAKTWDQLAQDIIASDPPSHVKEMVESFSRLYGLFVLTYGVTSGEIVQSWKDN
jgi:hypothetical protein